MFTLEGAVLCSSTIFIKKGNFVASFLLSYIRKPFLKMVSVKGKNLLYSIRKEFAHIGVDFH